MMEPSKLIKMFTINIKVLLSVHLKLYTNCNSVKWEYSIFFDGIVMEVILFSFNL